MALLWVLDYIEERESEEEAKYWTVKCLLDALVRWHWSNNMDYYRTVQ